MPIRHVPSIMCLVTLLSACGEPPVGLETTGTESGIDLPGSTSGGSSGDAPTGGDASASSGGDGASASTGGHPCQGEADCAETEMCDGGQCVFDPLWCGEPPIPAVIPPQVALVLDKSGSMVLNTWDGDADPNTPELTRWDSLHRVVEQIVGDFDATMELGAVLFPSTKAKANYEEACLMDDAPDVAVGPLHGAAILAAIPPASADGSLVAGGTPATAGVLLAAQHLAALPPGPQRFMVLITDGAANCKAGALDHHELVEVYDEALAPSVAAALADHAIATFVVGVDIVDATSPTAPDGQPDATNTHERLNEVALAGGVPRSGDEKFYNATSELELAAALQKIATQVSCEIGLDPAPTEDQQVVVELGGDAVAENADCTGGSGWHFADPLARDKVILCEDTCAAYQALVNGLAISYQCSVPG